jgi:hypothetical protein
MSGHTQRVSMAKCRCGDPICKQYTLSTQGSVGFDEADARLYTAAPDLLEALRGWVSAVDEMVAFEAANPNDSTKAWSQRLDALEAAEEQARAAIAKAEGRA